MAVAWLDQRLSEIAKTDQQNGSASQVSEVSKSTIRGVQESDSEFTSPGIGTVQAEISEAVPKYGKAPPLPKPENRLETGKITDPEPKNNPETGKDKPLPECQAQQRTHKTMADMHKFCCSLLCALVMAACSQEQNPTGNSLYVSILPLRSIVQEIVGDDLPVEVLVPAGASPETFEPTPKQFQRLNQALLIFNVGLIDFEVSLIDKLHDRSKVVDLSRGIQLMEGSCAHGMAGSEEGGTHDSEEHTHRHGIDPHVWTSPKALGQMARNAFEAIQSLYPDSVKYRENYERLQRKLQELDVRTREKLEQNRVEYFIVYHPALTYYARDYGIRQVAIETDGKDPSARQLAELIRNARKDGIHKIFYQDQFPRSVVEAVARDMQAECIEIDPLDEQVIENIDRITDLIVQP